MSIWDRLVPRTMEQLETAYPTWGDMDGKYWYTVMYGYVYSYPVIQAIQAETCFIGEPFVIRVRAAELIEPEFGGAGIETGDDFTGGVTVTFQGADYPLAYNTQTGLFEGEAVGPDPAVWSQERSAFTGTATAFNDRGSTSREFTLTAYKAIPDIVEVRAPECRVDTLFPLSARVVIATLPPGGDVTSMVFAGTVTAQFQGVDYPLSDAGGVWTASLPAPAKSSWPLEGHVCPGTITAEMSGETDTLPWGVRVLKSTPPNVARLTPTQDIFICNDCSPQYRWTVDGEEAGIAYVRASLDNGPHTPAEVCDGVACWQMPVVPRGQHRVTVYATDNDGNTAGLAHDTVGIELVTGRTKADVDRIRTLSKKGWAAMSETEREEYGHGMNIGAYNAADLNRVGTAVAYLTRRLAEHGRFLATEPKTDWQIADYPLPPEMARYLTDAAAVAEQWGTFKPIDPDGAFTFPPAALPDTMRALDYDGANRIELALCALEKIIDWVDACDWYYSVHARTWDDLEQAFPLWDDLEGHPWWQVQDGTVDLTILLRPWEVRDSRYP